MARILMVDDDHFTTQIFKIVFERAGHRLQIASSGTIALQELRGDLPNLVVLDLAMPGMSGSEVLRKIRATPRTRNLPVIVFSNSFLGETAKSELLEGPTRFLAKGDCSAEDLLEASSELMESVGLSAPDGLGGGADNAFFRSELNRGFSEARPELVSSLRAQWHAFIRNEREELRADQLRGLAKLARAVTSQASITGFQTVGQIASAFEALLLELIEDPQNINASTHRTMANAVDCLIGLLEAPIARPASSFLAGVALAVDDEITSLWAVCSALELAQIRPIAVDNVETALAVLKHNRFDLVFLDVEMPGKSGYEVCKELRGFVTNKTTPVVFVTGLSDFSSRAKSTLSGGNDFIAKPFLLPELAVKTLLHLQKSRETAVKK